MDFEQFIRKHYKTTATSRGEEVRICCPACSDSDYHLYVHFKRQLLHCFLCDYATRPVAFLARFHNMQSGQAFELLRSATPLFTYTDAHLSADSLKQRLEGDKPEIQSENGITLPVSHPVCANADSLLGRQAWQYLHSRVRGTSQHLSDLCERMNIRYAWQPPYEGRLILPVYQKKRLAWFQARAYWPATRVPVYRNPINVTAPLFIPYGVGKTIVLCEGYFDALALGRGAVALFGSSLSEPQRQHLLRLLPGRRVIVCLDDDEPGKRAAIKLCRGLRAYGELWVVPTLQGLDPDQLPKPRAWLRSRMRPFTEQLALEMLDQAPC